MEPKYLVMDEPGSGLDPEGREEIFSYVKRLHEGAGACVILVSHNMEDVARLARRVVVIEEGRIIMDGPSGDVFTRIGELEKSGLRAPETQYLLRRLKTVAPGIDEGAITVAQAANEIEKWLLAAGNRPVACTGAPSTPEAQPTPGAPHAPETQPSDIAPHAPETQPSDIAPPTPEPAGSLAGCAPCI